MNITPPSQQRLRRCRRYKRRACPGECQYTLGHEECLHDVILNKWAHARAINEEPWEPIAGMVKLRCEECGFLFATYGKTAICADCVKPHTRHRGPAI